MLLDRPEDAEILAEFLGGLGVPAVLAVSRFMALDLFRERPFQLVVSLPTSWGDDPTQFLDRFRAVDPDIRFCFVCDAGRSAPLEEAMVLERPLTLSGLERLRPFLRIPTHELEPAGLDEDGESSSGDSAETVASSETEAPAARTEDPDAVVPDALVAVGALLEAALDGRSFTNGLRSWAQRDPGISGLVVSSAAPDSEDFECRVWTQEPAQRAPLMQAVSRFFGLVPAEYETPRTHERFYVFRDPEGGGWAAVWLADNARGQEIAEKLTPLLPLIESVGRRDRVAPEVEPRERFSRLMFSRLKACERRETRLAILVAESGAGASAESVLLQLQSVLRGTDWLECIQTRVYAILDQPEAGAFPALEERLSELCEQSSLRLVGLAWSPRDGAAREGVANALLDRAEGMLAENRHRESFTLFVEEGAG